MKSETIKKVIESLEDSITSRKEKNEFADIINELEALQKKYEEKEKSCTATYKDGVMKIYPLDDRGELNRNEFVRLVLEKPDDFEIQKICFAPGVYVEKDANYLFTPFESKLQTVKEFDLRNLDLSSLLAAEGMFSHQAAEKIVFGNFATPNLFSIDRMFIGCKNLKTIDFGGMTGSEIVSFNSTFENCVNLQKCNIEKLASKKVSTMDCMFKNCKKMKDIDLSGFDCEYVGGDRPRLNMNEMCSGCTSLRTFVFGTHDPAVRTNKNSFSSVTSDNIFMDCRNIRSINFGKLSIRHFLNPQFMAFCLYPKLETVTFSDCVSKFSEAQK